MILTYPLPFILYIEKINHKADLRRLLSFKSQKILLMYPLSLCTTFYGKIQKLLSIKIRPIEC